MVVFKDRLFGIRLLFDEKWLFRVCEVDVIFEVLKELLEDFVFFKSIFFWYVKVFMGIGFVVLFFFVEFLVFFFWIIFLGFCRVFVV